MAIASSRQQKQSERGLCYSAHRTPLSVSLPKLSRVRAVAADTSRSITYIFCVCLLCDGVLAPSGDGSDALLTAPPCRR